jgi:hypothetical protein
LWHLCLTSASLTSPPPTPLVASHSCLPRLVVVLPPINLQLCDCCPPLPLLPMVGCCIFCPLHCLSFLLCSFSSCYANASRSASLGPLVQLLVTSPPSCPAGCCSCITSPHAAASHLPATLPLIALSPFVIPLSMPSPLAPLVWLVVVSPLLTPPPPFCQRLHLSLHQDLLSGLLPLS